jgi:HSP20 family protein
MVDLVEAPEAFVLRAEIPGAEVKDIEVQMTVDVLTLSGEKRQEEVHEGANLHFRERLYGKWRLVPAT